MNQVMKTSTLTTAVSVDRSASKLPAAPQVIDARYFGKIVGGNGGGSDSGSSSGSGSGNEGGGWSSPKGTWAPAYKIITTR